MTVVPVGKTTDANADVLLGGIGGFGGPGPAQATYYSEQEQQQQYFARFGLIEKKRQTSGGTLDRNLSYFKMYWPKPMVAG